jgi:hypothetical protein
MNPYQSRTSPRRNSSQEIYRAILRLLILAPIGIVFG